ncbi:MAG: coproporphyrinogen dehydrogenase, partial [Acetomicrobium sp.]|nr:coproporphyrinogen dehydrogenase [Acetomicrobium sp.]
NTREIKDYFDQITSEKLPVAYQEILPQDKQATEAAILALRTRWGVTATTFKRKYGWKAYRKFLDTWEKLPSDCRAACRGRHAFTPKGFRIANALWENFL